REDASFSRLSPSSTAALNLGIFTNLVIADVLTASGGATIPPSRNPKAMVNPGIKWLTTRATESAVKKTTIKAKLLMMRHHFFISLKELDQHASKSKGGMKMKKIRSGSIFTTGRPGIKLRSRPAITSRIG